MARKYPPGSVVGPKVRLPGGVRARGRTRHEPGRMNRTEADYAAYLEAMRLAGQIAGYWFEAVKLRLADRTWYTPDFLVMLADGSLEFRECKGWMEDDAAVKLKVAAEQFTLFPFVVVKRQGPGWVELRVS